VSWWVFGRVMWIAGNRTVKVLGKGNKERVIPVNEVLMAAIGEYCEKKVNWGLPKAWRGPDREFLLVGRKGGRNCIPNMSTGW
jgi:site-specific recombinase XerD